MTQSYDKSPYVMDLSLSVEGGSCHATIPRSFRVPVMEEKGRDMTQSYDKSPYVMDLSLSVEGGSCHAAIPRSFRVPVMEIRLSCTTMPVLLYSD